jgi:hypothetical protein
MKKTFLALATLLAFTCSAAVDDTVITEKVYVDNIKTVLLHPVGFEPALPVIELDGTDKLMLSFDDMDNDNKFYGFTFIHCNADWTPSQLMFTQHTDGLMTDQITDWRFSINTFKSYTNYRLTFPTDNMKPKVSGNFILKVFLADEPDKIILTKRFMVVEKVVGLTPTIQRARNPDDRNTKQELNFNIDLGSENVTNPFDYVKPVILQNERWDNAIYGLKPLYVNSGKLTYDYTVGNLYNGGNEFRRFDLRNARLVNDRVQKITWGDDKQWHFYLYEDKNRLINRYYVMDDINGRYFVRLMNGSDHYSEADYVWVNFELDAAYPVEGDVYVFGMLSGWQLKPEFKMTYNADKHKYTANVMVKQGVYDYEYVVFKNGKIDDTYIEGNHYETENTYHILVYIRAFGDRADRLVSVERLNSVTGN